MKQYIEVVPDTNIGVEIMKKLLLAFVLLLSLSTYAQKISVDQMESDGRHRVMTSMKNFKIEDFDYSMTLMVYESTDSLDWRLTVSSFNSIPKDNVILLKLNNGQTISLVVDSLQQKTYTTTSTTYSTGYVALTQPGITKPYWVSESRIKVEELDGIDAHGISKIRLGNNLKYIEEEWPNNPLGKHLTKCRKKIMENLKNSIDKKNNESVYDGF